MQTQRQRILYVLSMVESFTSTTMWRKGRYRALRDILKSVFGTSHRQHHALDGHDSNHYSRRPQPVPVTSDQSPPHRGYKAFKAAYGVH